jgi:hypothetical protein
MSRKKRLWDDLAEEDPAAGLLNLFDVWIAFAAALLLAMIGFYQQALASSGSTLQRELEALKRKGIKVEKYRPTTQKRSGEGERLGTAYRLANGEVVYVPENEAKPKAVK